MKKERQAVARVLATGTVPVTQYLEPGMLLSDGARVLEMRGREIALVRYPKGYQQTLLLHLPRVEPLTLELADTVTWELLCRQAEYPGSGAEQLFRAAHQQGTTLPILYRPSPEDLEMWLWSQGFAPWLVQPSAAAKCYNLLWPRDSAVDSQLQVFLPALGREDEYPKHVDDVLHRVAKLTGESFRDVHRSFHEFMQKVPRAEAPSACTQLPLQLPLQEGT